MYQVRGYIGYIAQTKLRYVSSQGIHIKSEDTYQVRGYIGYVAQTKLRYVSSQGTHRIRSTNKTKGLIREYNSVFFSKMNDPENLSISTLLPVLFMFS